ncbi:MAG: hypothetical protein IK045_05540 [Bacteroidales bacterium]|nr:hypothetical protein [Bacteroidales bacterium]
MKKTDILIAVLIAVLAVPALFSCKKNTEETIPSLAGSIYSYVPPYVERGDAFTVKASGIYAYEDDAEIVYRIKVDTVQTEYVTFDPEAGFRVELGEDEANFPNGAYTVYILASAEGYYSTSAAYQFNIIEPGMTGDGSLTGLGIDPEDSDKIEADGEDYYFKQIGSGCWLRHNLAVTAPASEYEAEGYEKDPSIPVEEPIFGGVYYCCSVMGDILGRYYTYEEAMQACPSGWHLPTEAEWAALAIEAGAEDKTYETGESFKGVAGSLKALASLNGLKLWEFWPQSEASDKLGFAALPSGYSVRIPGGDGRSDSFFCITEYATFWTADEYSDDSTKAWYRFITDTGSDMYAALADKSSFGASVRCVKD